MRKMYSIFGNHTLLQNFRRRGTLNPFPKLPIEFLIICQKSGPRSIRHADGCHGRLVLIADLEDSSRRYHRTSLPISCISLQIQGRRDLILFQNGLATLATTLAEDTYEFNDLRYHVLCLHHLKCSQCFTFVSQQALTV
jgi:hypothetical protein